MEFIYRYATACTCIGKKKSKILGVFLCMEITFICLFSMNSNWLQKFEDLYLDLLVKSVV